MDYTKSVYLPEIGISSRNHKDQMSAEDKNEVLKQTGVATSDPNKTILAQMMKQIRDQQKTIEELNAKLEFQQQKDV